MKTFAFYENGLYIVWGVDEKQELRLLHFSALPFQETDIQAESMDYGFRFVEMQLSGIDRPYERHGNKYIVTAPGCRMKYVRHQETRNAWGKQLVFVLWDEETNIFIDAYVQFYTGLSIVRCWQTVRNEGNAAQVLEYISSFHYEGIEKEGLESRDQKMKVWIPHNSWQRELNWKSYTFPELGQEQVQPDRFQRTSGVLRVSNTGNWSTKEYLPMGYLENLCAGTGLFWQIEHNGSWHWEIGDQNGHLYLAVSGPNEIYSHWSKELKPGSCFTTVPVAVGVAKDGMDQGMGILTSYRRRIRRYNEDNQKLPVIFNDYMNCLWGKPTAEEEYPLIDAAAEVGCEYYCIDAGWYSDGSWWDSVGEWKESRKRFPEGLRKIADYIRGKGMIPGVWLEMEVMGIHCPLAEKFPDEYFFVRHGKRVSDRSRYQLDYRNPKVREYADQTIDRIVSEYGVGYIKMDYNIEPGIGTETGTESAGQGMLEHERAYLAWLEGVWERYPFLVIENCSSGGLRMDYAMLSRYSIQSTSDQEDYRRYATIAANAPTGVTPEQAAVWTYPINHGDEISSEKLQEETVFNMVNAMLLRIHQSGHLAKLDAARKELVKEGIQTYKKIRADIAVSLPFWPLGLSSYSDEWSVLGLRCGDKRYLAVWRRNGNQSAISIPIKEWKGRQAEARMIYPGFGEESYEWNSNEGTLCAVFERENMARLFVLDEKKTALA